MSRWMGVCVDGWMSEWVVGLEARWINENWVGG